MQEIQNILHHWYQANKRDLPWRHTKDPYLIWISEIMLQQTQVAQGLPYYQRLTQRFPTVQDLAAAHEDEVLKLWQGLGYYSRARNLHFAAKQVVNDFKGIFPTKYDDLMTLKGVGDYTASAVASFSSDEAKACIDGNVIRVICRLFGVDVPYDVSQGQKIIRHLADELLLKKASALHNQAMMEFGALQCTPKNPNCETCPLVAKCAAFAKGSVLELPIKSKKTKVQALFLYYFVFLFQKQTVIQQRSESGIWKNMYEFPVLESAIALSEKEILQHLHEVYHLDDSNVFHFSTVYHHVLSHRKIQATFVQVDMKVSLPVCANAQVVKCEDLDRFPVSRLIDRYWEVFNV